MVNYNNSIVYKLCCKDPEITDIYIGSTTNFIRRKCNHNTVCNNENDKHHKLKVYQFIREHGGFDNWTMVQLKSYVCLNKRELLTIERNHFEELKPSLNSNIPSRTKREFYKQSEQVDKIKSQKQTYYIKNKDKIAETQKKYKENNKEVIAKKIAERQAIKVVCECGSEVGKDYLPMHKKSKKHIKFLETVLNTSISIIHT